MKKRILAATLIASMALAVGYSNGTNIKVTTQEGKVVEAKTAYRPPETTGKDGSLLLLNGFRLTNDFSSVQRNLIETYKQFNAYDFNGSKEYSYGQQSEVRLSAQLNGNSFKLKRLEVADSNAKIGEFGLWIGMKTTVNDLKERIIGTPVDEGDNILLYKCGDIYVALCLSNGKLSRVIYSF